MKMRPIFFALAVTLGAVAPAMAAECYEGYRDWDSYPAIDRLVLAEEEGGTAGRFFFHPLGGGADRWWRSQFTCTQNKKGRNCVLPDSGERFFMRAVPVDEITVRPASTISFAMPGSVDRIKLGEGLYDFLGFERMRDAQCKAILGSEEPLV